MTDGTKDWANIRIEEPVRDEARDDPRTYTEIMRAGLRVREDGPTADDVQEAFGLPDAAIPDDLREQLDEIQRVVEQNNGALGDTVEQALTIGEHGFTDIEEKLDRIESAVKEATNAAQNAERAAEDLQR